MQYPTISEYVKAIQDAGNNLDKLAHLTPVLDDHGEPYHMSDDFAVVFKMQDKSTGKYYALKCFLKDQKECADDACYQIDDEQNMVGASYSTSVKFLEKELLFHSQDKVEKFLVLLADWIDGKSMITFLSVNEDMTTSTIHENFNEAITDEYGVTYSKDGRKLLRSPKELDGNYSIKKDTKIICDWAFEGCTSLRSLVVPESVISIGESAFDGCTSLSSLVIPNRVVSIKGNLFCGWYGDLICLSPYFIYENNVLFDKDKSTIISFRDQATTSYVIQAGVTSIGDCAFEGCESLSNLVIPDSVTNIGDYAFYCCYSLESLIFPDGVTSIGEYAFRGCESLSNLVIPNSVTSVGKCAFYDCSSLSSIVISDSVTSIGERAFWGCSSLSSIVIPNSVTSVGKCAFYDCSSLSSIIIPDSVTSIGDSTFWGCSSLSSLVIPDSVTSIGVCAFRHCSSLSNVVIPDSITSIECYAFSDCSSLSSIVIPVSVTYIGHHAFANCNLSNTLRQELSSRFGDKIFW